mmetsp:Transcript_19220/g.28985  ORF Transcript_19220/g.28985 Transcript_19220/m.28985 type:complete len:162 (-) Transcript_19220:75-560(-)
MTIFATFIFFLCTAWGFSPIVLSPVHHQMQVTQRKHFSHFAVKLSTPSPERAAEMGIREWPQQLKSGSWSEEVSDGQNLVRYVLDGTGDIEIKEKDGKSKVSTVGPGALLEVSDQATLMWRVNSGEMIVLTPGYEQAGLFLGVAVSLILLIVVGTTLLDAT